jgi:hypothetical protein
LAPAVRPAAHWRGHDGAAGALRYCACLVHRAHGHGIRIYIHDEGRETHDTSTGGGYEHGPVEIRLAAAAALILDTVPNTERAAHGLEHPHGTGLAARRPPPRRLLERVHIGGAHRGRRRLERDGRLAGRVVIGRRCRVGVVVCGLEMAPRKKPRQTTERRKKSRGGEGYREGRSA